MSEFIIGFNSYWQSYSLCASATYGGFLKLYGFVLAGCIPALVGKFVFEVVKGLINRGQGE
jgi:hypothetical protein